MAHLFSISIVNRKAASVPTHVDRSVTFGKLSSLQGSGSDRAVSVPSPDSEEPIKRRNLQPPDETLARKRFREESSAIARRRAAGEIRLTAEEINDFLAHSDGDEDERGDDEAASDASSDWDAIQEETVEQFLSVAATTSSTHKASTSHPTTSEATAITGPSADYRDIGVEKLFSVASSQQLNDETSKKDGGIAAPKAADDEDEDILSLTGARPDDLNEFGTKVQSSMVAAARERHDRRVQRDVKQAIQAAEEEEAHPTPPAREVTPPASPGCKDIQSKPAGAGAAASSVPSDLTESQHAALKLREEKRKQTVAALGKSPASGGPAIHSTTSGGNYFVATPTNIRVMRPLLSSELWATRTAGRSVFSLVQFLQEAGREAPKRLAAFSQATEFVVVGVIGSKTPPRRSKNDKIYSIWRLTDMAGVGTGGAHSSLVSLFLFGSVHEKLWKESEGTVVAILKPKIMSPSDMDDSGREVSITVDSAPFVMVLGISPDFGTCAGTTKSNKPCSRIINKSVCRYCDFHVKSAYYAASSIRPGFSTTNFPWTGHSKGRGGRGGGGRGWTTGRAREIGGGGGSGGGIFSLPRPATMPVSGTSDERSLHPGVNNSSFVRPKLSLAKLTSAGYSIASGPAPAIITGPVPPVPSDAAGGGIAAQNALTPVEQTLASRLSLPSMGSRNLLRHLEKANPVTPSPSRQISKRKSADAEPSPTPPTLTPSPHPKPKLPVPAPTTPSVGTFANFFAGRSSSDRARPSAISRPVLGRGLQAVSPDRLIDLGPVVLANASPHTSDRALPAMSASRRRAEAFVRARGGVARLEEEEARKDALGTRVSELVARSASARTARPSPLSELLDNTPRNDAPTKAPSKTIKTNIDLQETEKSRKEAKRAEMARLVSQGSQYTELVELEADLSDRSLLCRLEKRDEVEERLLSQHEQECQIVTCKTCNYRSLRADRECRKQSHLLEFSTGTRRFYACRNCKTRTTTLDRYPTLACKNCGESLFEKAGAIAERKGPKLLSEKLLARGLEEKYFS